MAQPISPARYSTVAIILHWLIAGAIVFQILVAWRMNDLHTPLGFALTQLHKSVGITVLLLSVARLGWRIAYRPPPEVETLATWERVLSKVTHLGFYVIMIGMPLTGWIMVSASKTAIPTLLYGAIPWPHLPGIPELPEAAKAGWRAFGNKGHEILAWGAYGLILLHVAGALKHQLFDRDTPVLHRMAPGAKAGRWFDPRLLLIALGGLVVLAVGQFLKPPLPVAAPLAPPPAEADDSHEAAPAASEVPAPTAATAAPTDAAAAAPAVPAPTEPSHWAVGRGSTVGFSTTWSGAAIEGRFDKWTADILFGPEALAKSKVSVSIDLASVATGDAQRDQSLPASDWFDATAHPKATFTAERFEKTGEGRYVAHGKLSLRGVTKPVDLPFKLKIDGDKASMSGVTTVDRTAFGVGQGEWQATDQIPASVKVSVQLTATRR